MPRFWRVIFIVFIALALMPAWAADVASQGQSPGQSSGQPQAALPPQDPQHEVVSVAKVSSAPRPAQAQEQEVLPYYRRLALKRQTLWIDAEALYWFFIMYQNLYSLMPPTIQTGHIGPKISVGLQRLKATGEYSLGTTWVRTTTPGVPDTGYGVTKRYDLQASLDIYKDLYLGAGIYHFEARPVTNLGFAPLFAIDGYYLSFEHKAPITTSTKHGLRYGIHYFPQIKQTKAVSVYGYDTLGMPAVEKYGVGYRAQLMYNYSFDMPMEYYFGCVAEFFNGEKDLTGFIGPRMGLNVKL